jgi:glyoxylase-like metal-dependent hydrolase (beta-lactamase superfamily II)
VPSRHSGIATAILIGIGLITAPVWAGGKPTPYDLINASAASSPITVHRLRGSVAMLEGSGGNIGVLTAPGGKLMVDAGIGVSEAKIKAALAGLGVGPLKRVILTHWHWDHSDGDGWVRRTGARLMA